MTADELDALAGRVRDTLLRGEKFDACDVAEATFAIRELAAIERGKALAEYWRTFGRWR